MSTLSTTVSLLTHSLAWALLYSLWQGMLIYGTLYVLLKALPNINARVKYYLSYGAFMGLFLWFADTWATQYQKLKGVTVYITQSGTESVTSNTYSVKAIATEPAIQSDVLHHFLSRLEQYFPFIIMLYVTGLVFMLFRFAVNIWQVGMMRKQGVILPGTQWSLLLEQLQTKFEMSRPVRLFISTRINVPMMLGVIKPMILLPVATINNLSTDQVEAILMHELAHIKRHDYLLNILQTIIETVLFFNPFVWLISSVTRREREHCCDDLVISRSASPLTYAKALAILEHTRSNDNGLVLAATGRKKQLLNRIKRIMEMKKSKINYSQFAIIIVAIIAITFSIAMFTFSPSFAQQAKKDQNDTTANKKTTYTYKTITVDSNGKRTEINRSSNKPLKDKDKNDDDNVDINISVSDDTDGANRKSGKAYTYAYSNDDDFNKVIKEITIATKGAIETLDNVDFKELERDLENAEKEMHNVDWDEIKTGIKKSLDEVDKELDNAKMHKEICTEARKGLEESKKALEKAEKEIEKNHHAQIIAHAMAGNSKTKVCAKAGDEEDTNTDFESMLVKMEKDGLINRSKSYKVVKEKSTLYINGNKQPATVYDKYQRYLSGNKVTIKGHKGSLSISVSD